MMHAAFRVLVLIVPSRSTLLWTSNSMLVRAKRLASVHFPSAVATPGVGIFFSFVSSAGAFPLSCSATPFLLLGVARARLPSCSASCVCVPLACFHLRGILLSLRRGRSVYVRAWLRGRRLRRSAATWRLLLVAVIIAAEGSSASRCPACLAIVMSGAFLFNRPPLARLASSSLSHESYSNTWPLSCVALVFSSFLCFFALPSLPFFLRCSRSSRCSLSRAPPPRVAEPPFCDPAFLALS